MSARNKRSRTAAAEEPPASKRDKGKRKRQDEPETATSDASPKKPSPQAIARQQEVVRGVCEHESRGDGRVLSTLFMKLPSKRSLPDYYEVISEPIDLRTISANVTKGKYSTMAALLADLDLMFSNAQKYNEPGSEVFNDARTLRKLAKRLAADAEKDDKQPRDGGDGSDDSASAGAKLGPKQLAKHMQQVLDAVRARKAKDGRELSTLFEKLPAKKHFADYYKLIKNPIDLYTIQRRLNANVYRDMAAFEKDMMTMFDNAMFYNEDGSEVFLDAKVLRKVATAAIRAGLQDEDDGGAKSKGKAAAKPKTAATKSKAASKPKAEAVKLKLKVKVKQKEDTASEDDDQDEDEDEGDDNEASGSEEEEGEEEESGDEDSESGSESESESEDGGSSGSESDGGDAKGRSGKKAAAIKVKIKAPAKQREPIKLSIRTPDNEPPPADSPTAAKKSTKRSRKQGAATPLNKRQRASDAKATAGGGTAAGADSDDGDNGDHAAASRNERSDGEKSVDGMQTPKKKRGRPKGVRNGEGATPLGTKQRRAAVKLLKQQAATKTQQELCVGVWQAVRACVDDEGREVCEIFLELPHADEYPDYYNVIKKPMAMDIIRRKIDEGKYPDLAACVADFHLMFDNAQTYNQVGSEVYADAQKLRSLVRSAAKASGASAAAAAASASEQTPKTTKKRQRRLTAKRARKTVQRAPDPEASLRRSRKGQPPPVFKLRPSDSLSWVTDYELNDFFGLAKASLFKVYPSLRRQKPTDEERALLVERAVVPPHAQFSLVAAHDAQEIMAGRDALYKVRPRATGGGQAAQGGDESHDILVAALAGSTLVLGKQQPAEGRKQQLQGQELYQTLFDHVRAQTGAQGRKLCESFLKLPARRDYPDYYQIISYPIDMTTIQSRIRTDAYEDAITFAHDFLLVFKNAQIYNEEDSQIYDDAAILFEEFARKARELLPRQTALSILAIRRERSPLQSIMDNLMMALQATEQNTRRLCEGFNQLPDPKEFPEYYDAITQPVALCTIRERIETNYYHRLDQFQSEIFLMLQNARSYNEVNSELYNDSVQLQKVFISMLQRLAKERRITSPALDYTLEKFESDLQKEALADKTHQELEGGEEDKREYTEQVTALDGLTYHVGEYVYIENTVKCDGEPHIGCVARLWTVEGTAWCRVLYFYRPGETFHVASRAFYKQEVLRSNDAVVHPVSSLKGKCYVAFVRDYLKTEAEGFDEKDVYICESRYSTRGKSIQKIKLWQKPEFDFALKPRLEPLVLAALPKVKSVFYQEPEEPVEEQDARNVQREAESDVEDAGDDDDVTHYALYYSDGVPYRLGDCVYVASAEDVEPHIARIEDIWTDKDKQPWFFGSWFIRPADTHHEPTRQFFQNEVLRSSTSEPAMMSSIIAPCSVLSLADYCRQRPLSVHDEDVFVCESRYYEKRKLIAKIKTLGNIRSTSLDKLPGPETMQFAQPIVPKKVPSPLLAKMQEEQQQHQNQQQQQQRQQQQQDHSRYAGGSDSQATKRAEDARRRATEEKLRQQAEKEARHADRLLQKQQRKAAKAAAIRRALETQAGIKAAPAPEPAVRTLQTGFRVFENEQRALAVADGISRTAPDLQRNIIHKWQALGEPSRKAYENAASACATNSDVSVVLCGWSGCQFQALTGDRLKEHILRDHVRYSTTFACQWFACAEAPFYERSRLAGHVVNLHIPLAQQKIMPAREYFDRQPNAATRTTDPSALAAWHQQVDQSDMVRLVAAESKRSEVQYSQTFLDHLQGLSKDDLPEPADPPPSAKRAAAKQNTGAVCSALRSLGGLLQGAEGPLPRT
eukprot:m.44552 g.44552  ORF g.44552 m.44552 type:complete len:1812 (+) comp11717_c0_seq1:111-5546(+)